MRPLLLFLLLSPFFCKAQTDTVENFRVDNREIVWQKVFQTSLSAGDLFAYFKNNGLFIHSTVDSLQMTGELRHFSADYKGAGYSRANTPAYLNATYMNAFSIIEYKEGRYIVTLKRILLEQENSGRLSNEDPRVYLNEYALRGKKFTPGFKKSPNKTLDYTFTQLFTIMDISKRN